MTTGSRTQLYSLTAAASVLAVLLFPRPVLSRFPTAALGAIAIYAAIRLIDVPAFRGCLPSAAPSSRSPCPPAPACWPSTSCTGYWSRSACR